MQKMNVFLLDFNPESGLGSTLREILELNDSPSFYFQEKSVESAGFDAFVPELSKVILHFNPNIIFLSLHPNHLNPIKKLIQSVKGKPVIAINEGFETEEMIELFKVGVSDFIVPPLKAADVLPRVWRLLEQKQPEEQLIHALKEKIGLKQLVGKSAPFLSEIEKIPMVSQCDVSVLISGETGTGKELFARAVHYLSNRTGRPFVPISCGAIPTELIENELFGHERGAFTGATSRQAGLVAEAEGGTLFLDDVDCLPLVAQVKMLRLLQEKEFRPLGATKHRQADVRVIAATNIVLEQAVREMKFRQDLFYRLNIIPLVLPPLRERKGDIPLLARHFLEKYAVEFEKGAKEFTGEALQKLVTYEWPGNVRELENVVERAVVFSKESIIDQVDILCSPAEGPERESFRAAKARMIERFEKNYIENVLCAYRGNISKAAEAVQKNRRAFWELIRKHRIDVDRLKFG